MGVWLGKQILGQSDQVQHQFAGQVAVVLPRGLRQPGPGNSRVDRPCADTESLRPLETMIPQGAFFRSGSIPAL